MSIASELEDLQTNVAAAQEAVVAKGGTVTGGLADLATNIEEIPSGGGETTPETQYGAVLLYNTVAEGPVVDTVESCTVEVVDAALFMEFARQHPKPEWAGSEFSYRIQGSGSGSSWYWNCEIEMEYVSIGTPEAIGLHIIPNEGATWVEADMKVGDTPVPADGTTWVEMEGAADFAALSGSSSSTPLPVNGVNTPRAKFKGATVGTEITSIPNYFLNVLGNLEFVDFSHATALTTIGDSFLSRCSNFNSDIVLPDTVTTIGEGFLSSCTSFNSTLKFSSRMTEIPSNFLNNCKSFNQPITFPDTITAMGNSIFAYCKSLNQKIVLPSRLQSLGSSFLTDAEKFDQDIYFPGSIGTLTTPMTRCSSYMTGTITIGSGITTIEGNSYNVAFGLGSTAYGTKPTSKVIIPDTVTSFDSYCFKEGYIGELVFLSGVTTIPTGVLGRAAIVKVTIPSTVTSLGTLLSSVTYLEEVVTETTVAPTGNSLTASGKSVASYNPGITLRGAGASAWKNALPDSANSPYRKLVLAS